MSTQKNYKACEKQYHDLEKKRIELKKRKVEIETRFEQLKTELSLIDEELGAALADGVEGEKMKEIEDQRNQILREYERCELSLPAIMAKFKKLNEEIHQVINQKNEVFADLATIWLKKETKGYDKKAKAVLTSLRRVLVAHRLMREADCAARYKEIVGPGFEYLPGARVPVLEDFDRVDYLEGLKRPEANEKAVFDEIVNQN
ncbi:MAG TPA: hypothetical protein VMW09_03490 [Desulfatiglandales bacterium]|nr:hypothetical protein [Desulfatiglandales bacterium]